jgi:flagellar hook-basal body complex protein FliE
LEIFLVPDFLSSLPGVSGLSGLSGAGRTSPLGSISSALDSEETLSAGGGGSVGPAFGEVLSGFLGKVNDSQQKADSMVESLALGEPVDVHQVMMSLNDASNAMQITMQVRNKALEAYQELMRLPM